MNEFAVSHDFAVNILLKTCPTVNTKKYKYISWFGLFSQVKKNAEIELTSKLKLFYCIEIK